MTIVNLVPPAMLQPWSAVVPCQVDPTIAKIVFSMLPLTSGDRNAAQSAVVVRQSTLLDALIALFEMMWRSSSPLRLTGQRTPEATDRLAGVDAEILSLLSAGLKDETIARQLGLSLRTLQLGSASCSTAFGARTRVQAGYAVARERVLDE